jgi:hypothetical protein
MNERFVLLGTIPESDTPAIRWFARPLPVVRRPSGFTICLSTLYACDPCLGLVGLVACDKQ